jgi:aspartate aminotransferase
MSIAEKIGKFIEASSWIRKMFEEGAQLKAQYGADNVFDFSLGNPNVDPPDSFYKVLGEAVKKHGMAAHGYMPNAGYPSTRAAVAGELTRLHGIEFTQELVLMSVGAAGALNAILKAILNPGDEIVVPKPYFVEYNFYVDNHGGVIKLAPTAEDFSLDVSAIEKTLTPKTAAVLINSPNNPTGRVYSAEQLSELGKVLSAAGEKFGRTIYLISDEPYRKIVYDNITVPSHFQAYKNSLLATSYSKDLSLPGERIGYAAVHPEADNPAMLMAGITLANRILGFVNAPALMQRVVERLQGESVDISGYQRKRDLLCDGLEAAGYEFAKPEGAFYLFPKSPVTDDVEFVKLLKEERILAVPGSGFGGPGYIRLAYCVDDKTIELSIPGFKRAMEKARG